MNLSARCNQRPTIEMPSAVGALLHSQHAKAEVMLERAPIATGAALLHNMSCRPNTAVTHTGVDQCHRICILTDLPRPPNSLFTEFCETFGVDMPEDGDGWKALTDAANLPCPELMLLPAVAAVLVNAPGNVFPGISDNPRLALAVLARCSGGIFIRDRPPVITSDHIKNTITLIAPLSWRPPS